ncbi:pol-like protein [Purpureocillium lavendulum]|uniref:Pol-like protein n=1 Tax=Purpureocillium lavendulum TaxID=1247861 RepID=A0AB34FC54_9HYPO|nr:pol-like protein [Purpureocillium lavendulum]
MAEHQLKKIRPLDFFTNTGLSVHYKASRPSIVTDLEQTVYDTKEPYWGRLPSIDLKQAVSFVQRSQPLNIDSEGRDRELDALLETQHNTSFKSGYGTLPVWRVMILQDHGATHRFTACFIAHHSMTDGTALQTFHHSFQKALCDVSSCSLPSKAEHIIFSRDDPIAPTRYMSLHLALHLMKPFTQECRKHKVAPTAALPSLVARLLYNSLPSTTESLTCNLPVSLRSDLPPKLVDGVLGNFIDAFKVKLLRSDLCDQDSDDSKVADSSSIPSSMEIWNHARKIQEATRGYFANVSPSGELYAKVAIFKLIPDIGTALTATLGNPRSESFEVSNLGHFSQPTNLNGGSNAPWQSGDVLLSRGAYAAGVVEWLAKGKLSFREPENQRLRAIFEYLNPFVATADAHISHDTVRKRAIAEYEKHRGTVVEAWGLVHHQRNVNQLNMSVASEDTKSQLEIGQEVLNNSHRECVFLFTESWVSPSVVNFNDIPKNRHER